MWRSIGLITAAFLSFSLYFAAHASAADLYAPSLKDGPYEQAPVSWTGLYFGVHAGYGHSKTDVDLSRSTGAIFYNDPFVPDHGSLNSADGFVGGLQAGFNYQRDRIVLGLEADVTWSDLENDGTFTTPLGSQWAIKSALNDFGTVRARLGYLVHPDFLLYGTGGLAWGQFNVHQATTFVDPNTGNFLDDGGRTSGDFDQLGFVVGAGAEWRLSQNWSLKAEYLFMDFGTTDYQLRGTTKPGGNIPYVETFSADNELHIIRAGLNYHF